jgi:hypothetical protein
MLRSSRFGAAANGPPEAGYSFAVAAATATTD